MSVWIARLRIYSSLCLLFFFYLVTIVDQVFREQCIRALFTDPQISLFNNFFIKNGFHGTIHTFKNDFVTVFSVFGFQFSAK